MAIEADHNLGLQLKYRLSRRKRKSMVTSVRTETLTDSTVMVGQKRQRNGGRCQRCRRIAWGQCAIRIGIRFIMIHLKLERHGKEANEHIGSGEVGDVQVCRLAM